MTWELLTSIPLTSDWSYTPVIDPAYSFFRFTHINPQLPARIECCQAQINNLGSNLEIFSNRFLVVRQDTEIFRIECPPFFDQRRIAVRLQSALDASVSWNLSIERFVMPLSRNVSDLIRSTSVSATKVTASTAQVDLLASNPARLGATVWNSSGSNLFLDLGNASDSAAYGGEPDHAVRLKSQDYYEIPFGYTGKIVGLWDGTDGVAHIREFT